GYVAATHLVTKTDIASDGGANNIYDPANGYRDEYRKIWGR
ncbi:MAG: ribose transport system substrate-binding protein, partial [Blastocatellia bacterium]|nr:ribose transport system substrate-binding protein [Blastocatellia bacterium]